ncbi:hypothetical protein Anas_03152 [Armadillidium nasatum]|uniref:Uncharacterized protein n=1 Tax=Armadillidium nasatum TaxID=96803 RepID=A0A5N5SY27_9CRUS|nr:hypothetical protein Anas_03152 [Armadillidium nasatum]
MSLIVRLKYTEIKLLLSIHSLRATTERVYIVFFLAAEADVETDSKFLNLCDDYFKWRVSDMPQYATRIGIHDSDTELNDMSEEAYESRFKMSQTFLRKTRFDITFLDKSKTSRKFYLLKI